MLSVLILAVVQCSALAIPVPVTASSPAPSPGAEHYYLRDLIVAGVIEKQEELRKKNETPWLAPASIIAILTTTLAIVSLGFNFFQSRRSRSDTLEWKEKDARAIRQSKLLDSLTWFEGGIQKRALGLAVMEGHWSTYPELRSTWAAVLLSQATYIVSKPEAALPPHEFENLQHIFELLRTAKKELSLDESTFSSITRIIDSLSTKTTQTEKGERLSPTERKPFLEQVLSLARSYPDVFALSEDPRLFKGTVNDAR